MTRFSTNGFTLIELSIVLVVIGLIVGGVLTGRDLIRAAEVRAQVSQIERFNTAVNTFREKYDALPGDIPANLVTQFGFTVVPTRLGSAGQGDGNGIIEGYSSCCGVNGVLQETEFEWFWEDLTSNSGLIEGSFSTSTEYGTPCPGGLQSVPLNLPAAKIGGGDYVYINSINGINYFLVSNVLSVNCDGAVQGTPGLTVAQAYAVDKKMDDGYPQTGVVTARYQNWGLVVYAPIWAGGPGADGANSGAPGYGPTNAPTTGSSNTCYDNSNGSGPQQYSLEIASGSNPNCGLMFQFQ